jgi:hypothetical protein
VNLCSTFGEFIFNQINRRGKSFLSTPFQEPEAAGIVDCEERPARRRQRLGNCVDSVG